MKELIGILQLHGAIQIAQRKVNTSLNQKLDELCYLNLSPKNDKYIYITQERQCIIREAGRHQHEAFQMSRRSCDKLMGCCCCRLLFRSYQRCAAQQGIHIQAIYVTWSLVYDSNITRGMKNKRKRTRDQFSAPN